MSRPLRIQGAGLAYHVVARGNNKMTIFKDALDYARFLQIYRKTIERFALDSWVVCAMPNHYHLVFRTRQPNLSAAVEYLNGQYARWWNRRHSHVGHVFQGRFKGQVIEHGSYLLRVCRYVLQNPVRAGLVRHPDGWKWSSYQYLATDITGDLVDIPSLLIALDPDEHPATRLRLLDFVEASGDADIADFVRSDRRVIGSEAFVAQFRSTARQASLEVPGRERALPPTIMTLLATALERGESIAVGVRAACAHGHSILQIAKVSGLSPRSVGRLVNPRRRRGNQGGTGKGPVADLAREQPRRRPGTGTVTP